MEKERTISDMESDITGNLFTIEALTRLARPLFDKCGKSTGKDACDGVEVKCLMEEKIAALHDLLTELSEYHLYKDMVKDAA